MKLRLPNKLQATLLAAFTAVAFTLPQAQAAEYNLAFFNLSADSLIGPDGATSLKVYYNPHPDSQSVYALTISTTWEQGLGSGTTTYTTFNAAGVSTDLLDTNAGMTAGSLADTYGTFISAGAKDDRADLTITLSGLQAGYKYDVSLVSGIDFEGQGSWSDISTPNTYSSSVAELGDQKIQAKSLSGYAVKDMVADASGCITFTINSRGSHTAVINGIAITTERASFNPAIRAWAGTEQDHVLTTSAALYVWDPDNCTATEFPEDANLYFDETGWQEVTVASAITAHGITVSGAAYTFNLAGGSLTIGGLVTEHGGSVALTGAGVVIATTIDAPINIGRDVVLYGGSTAAAVLSGEGTYALMRGATTKGSIVLGKDWTGAVRISDVGSSSSKMQKMDEVIGGLANSKSSVELNNLQGWLNGNVSTNIRLLGTNSDGTGSAVVINDGSSGKTRELSGTISGKGDWEHAWTGGTNFHGYKISGDITNWTGNFHTTGNGSVEVRLEYSGNATHINSGISHERNSALNVTITNANEVTMAGAITHAADKTLNLVVNAPTTFTNNVSATSLTVGAGKTATFGGTTNISGGVTLGAGATLKNTGTMTLGALEIAADGTLQVASGTTTVSGGTNAINKTLEIGAEGTLSLTAGSYALDGLAVQGYTQEYVGDEGQTIPTGSGFLRTSGTVQVANILSGGALNIGTDATFTYSDTAVEVATDTGIGTLTGEVNYSTLYVNNGEPVSYAAAQAIAQAQPGSPTVDSVHLTVDGATINMDAAATIGLAIADNATGTVNATADTSISGITGAPAKLIVTGDSVVTLTTANSITAAVEIDGTATLKMGNAGALGNTSGVTVYTGATLDVNGAKDQGTCISVTLAGGKLANTGGLASHGSKQLVNSLVVANNSIVDAQNNDFGLVSGSYAESTLTLNATLEKIGSYDFHLANTTVTGEGAIKVTEGAVWFGRADAAAIGSYASDFIMNGGNVKGRLALADNITVTTVANGGTFSANVTNNGHTITFDGAGNLTMSGAISGNGGIIKEGNGILTLNGTQTYTGDTVVKGGTLDIQGSISDNSMVKVEESASIVGHTENITVGIASGETATFTNEGGYTPKDSHVTFSSKELGVVVSNLGNEEAVYSLDNGKMRVTAQQMVVDISADQDVQVDNVLAVKEITNLGPVSLKLTSVVGKTLDDVIAYAGDIEIDNLEEAQRLRELSIGSGTDVTFLQKLGESETAAKEATVTIAEYVGYDQETGAEDYYYGGTLHAGGGTLHANLVLSHFSFWDLDGGSMNLGSELTLRDSIWLDADTIKALDRMEIGETHWMVNAVDGTQITYSDADVWYDSKFVRDAYEDDGTSLKGDFIIVQNNDGTKWGLKKVSDTPEPTTGTLSLLALCALAARRRRK